MAMIEVEGEDAPLALRVAGVAEGLPSANAILAVGIGNRQGLQYHGMNEREDGCGCADAEAEG
jgi:hypothetical protein